MTATRQTVLQVLSRPAEVVRGYRRQDVRGDLVAALTVAVVLLPQAIAYAQIAELPATYGLNAAVVAGVVGGLWGSSHHLQIGPTNASSLIVLSSLAAAAHPGSPEFLVAAGLLAVMVGVMQVVLGLARLGVLVNFVSRSVVVGFTTGAAALIAIKQLRPLLGLQFEHPPPDLPRTITAVLTHLGDTHGPTAAVGVGVMVLLVLFKRIHKQIPGPLLAICLAAAAVRTLGLADLGVALIGDVPVGLPRPTAVPVFDLELIQHLSAGALAVGVIGLTETTSIARAIADRSGQRLDSNQEMVGLGMANIVSGLFSGYSVAGSTSRSTLLYDSGGRTSMAGVFTGLVILGAVLTVGPFLSLIPKTALSGVLIVIAIGMINWREIARVWGGAPGDSLVMTVTFAATLLLHLEFAVLLGVLLSFALYIRRTSVPRVFDVVPDERFARLVHRPEAPRCPQLGILTIHGDLYFGAVSHVEEEVHAYLEARPDVRFLLIRMRAVNHCDFAGAHFVYEVYHALRERGGAPYFADVHASVLEVLQRTGLFDRLGPSHFLLEDQAIGTLFQRILDPAICIYECPNRVFRECQNLPKREYPSELPVYTDVVDADLERIAPRELWQALQGDDPPTVIDVREPREYRRGHVPGAVLLPLLDLFHRPPVPTQRRTVVVCLGGRRSARAAALLQERGHTDVAVLDGGMRAWRADGLLQGIE